MPTTFSAAVNGAIIEPADVNQFEGPINNLETGAAFYGGAASGTNSYVVSVTPAPVSYSAGMILSFRVTNANSGASSLKVSPLTAAPVILKNGSSPLVAGDLVAGQLALVLYDGTNFQLLNPASVSGGGGSGSLNYYGTSSGTNTYTATVSPAPASLYAGLVVYVKMGAANTSGTCTLAVNSLAAESIVKCGSASLGIGDLVANEVAIVVYDGTNFQLLNPSGILPLAHGGTGADLSASGGSGFVLKQSSAGAAITAAALVAGDIPSLPASQITSGFLALARGGTNADLSATGGTGQVLKQTSAGGSVTVAALASGDIPSLPASQITSGVFSTARIGSGTPAAGSYVDGGTGLGRHCRRQVAFRCLV